MSQAEELLNNLTEDSTAAYTATPDTEPHIVVNNDRTITVPTELKRIAVQFDHNIETVTFDCPRYWDEHDMSEMSICINYMRADGQLGMFSAENVVVDETDDHIMHFTWTITRFASSVKGNLSFLVCIKTVDDDGYETVHWNSELNKELYISEGLETSDYVQKMHADVITQLLLRMDHAEGMVNDHQVTIMSLNNQVNTLRRTVDIIDELIDTHQSNITDLLNRVADLEYEPIVITSFTNNKNEVMTGSKVSNIVLSWIISPENITPEHLYLDDEEIDTTLTGITLTDLTIESNKTWTLKAIDARNAASTKTTKITFLNLAYYGAAAELDLTMFTGLNGEKASSRAKKFTVNAAEGEYIWYLVPTRFGTCSFKVGGFDGGFNLTSVEPTNITNDMGYEEPYYIYRSANAGLGNTTVEVT